MIVTFKALLYYVCALLLLLSAPCIHAHTASTTATPSRLRVLVVETKSYQVNPTEAGTVENMSVNTQVLVCQSEIFSSFCRIFGRFERKLEIQQIQVL